MMLLFASEKACLSLVTIKWLSISNDLLIYLKILTFDLLSHPSQHHCSFSGKIHNCSSPNRLSGNNRASLHGTWKKAHFRNPWKMRTWAQKSFQDAAAITHIYWQNWCWSRAKPALFLVHRFFFSVCFRIKQWGWEREGLIRESTWGKEGENYFYFFLRQREDDEEFSCNSLILALQRFFQE